MPSNVISYVNNLKKNTNLTDLQEDVNELRHVTGKNAEFVHNLWLKDQN